MPDGYTEADLRVLLPAFFPGPKPCINLGAAFWVSLHRKGAKIAIAGGSRKLCSSCTETVKSQADSLGLWVTVKAI